nr:hypothetical protein [Tanacetum cinerariifolium]
TYFMIHLPSRTTMISLFMFISMLYTIARAIYMHDYDMLSPSHGALAQVESRLVEYKEREVKYIEKIRTLEFHNESKNECIEILKKKLETLKLEKDGRSDKNKEGLGYSVVPPPPTQLYLSPKKDLSWTGLLELTDYSRPSPTVESTSGDDQNINSSASENGRSTDSILSKHAVKFVKAAERSTTNKVETVKKPSVRYAKLYKKPSKKSTVMGNQRNWNNLKSQQLGNNFVMKKKACYNCGDFSHLAYDWRKMVKKGTSRSQNKTHESFTPKPVVHRPFKPPVRSMRSNMNGARPNKTSFNKQGNSGIKLEDSVRTKRSRGTRNLKIQKLNIKFRGGLLRSKSI